MTTVTDEMVERGANALADLIGGGADEHNCHADARRILEAALSAQQQSHDESGAVTVPVPEGWQLVPKEATHEMLCAVPRVTGGKLPTLEPARRIWTAMLAAAPSPHQQPKREVRKVPTSDLSGAITPIAPIGANATAGAPINEALDTAAAILKARNEGKTTLPADPFATLQECARWLAFTVHELENVLATQQPDIRAQVIVDLMQALEVRIVNSDGLEVAEDSLHELRKNVRRAVEALATKST